MPVADLGSGDLRSRDIWLVRVLVQNGLAMFATWGTVASMFNFAVVLTYRSGARQDVSSTVSLSIFTAEIVLWWIVDNFREYVVGIDHITQHSLHKPNPSSLVMKL